MALAEMMVMIRRPDGAMGRPTEAAPGALLLDRVKEVEAACETSDTIALGPLRYPTIKVMDGIVGYVSYPSHSPIANNISLESERGPLDGPASEWLGSNASKQTSNGRRMGPIKKPIDGRSRTPSLGLEEQRRRFEARLAELHAAYAPPAAEGGVGGGEGKGGAGGGKKKKGTGTGAGVGAARMALTGEQVRAGGRRGVGCGWMCVGVWMHVYVWGHIHALDLTDRGPTHTHNRWWRR